MSKDEDLAHASRILEAAIAARHVTLKIDEDLLRMLNTKKHAKGKGLTSSAT